MSSGDYERDDLDLLAAARSERPRGDLRARALVAASLAGGAAVTKVVATKIAATKVGAKVGFGATFTGLFAGARLFALKPLVAIAVVASASALVVDRTRDVDAREAPMATLDGGRATFAVAGGAVRQILAKAHAVAATPAPPGEPPSVDAPRPPPSNVAAPTHANGAGSPPRLSTPVRNVLTEATIARSNDTHPAAPPPRSSLGDEMELVDAARAELRKGDVSSALSRLEVHASRFPSGILAVERDALRIEALAARGAEAEALVAARAFALAHPGAPLPPRARRVLERDPKNAGAVSNP
jgi:hypothetical protein